MRADPSPYLAWIDLEMTGLDPERDVILEIGSLVTDNNLEILGEGPNLAIHQSDETLARMDDWNQKHHGKSGLIDRVRQSTESMASAAEKSIEFFKTFAPSQSMPLCGNSIWQDRRFLGKHMPPLEAFFHYRIVDVSSIKELALRWYPSIPIYRKQETHLAQTDIRESVFELRHWRAHLFVPVIIPENPLESGPKP